MNNFVDVVVVVFVIVVHVLVKTSHANGQSHSMCSSETNIAKAMVVQKGGKVTLQSVAQLRLPVCIILYRITTACCRASSSFLSVFLCFLTGVIIAINALKTVGPPFCSQNVSNSSAE